MALKWADNVIEQSTATTTGAYQLAGVPSTNIAPGAQGFVAGIGDTNTCYYYAYEVSGTAWERGLGTVADAATDTLTRTTIYASSNAGSAVDWTGKTVRIRVVEPARRLYHDHAYMVENLTITTSRTGNAETIALKTLAGNDPSVADPIRIGFNDASGGFSVLEITAATSIVLSSGSTLGATNATIFRVWLVAFNDSGTFRLGAIKCALTDGVYGLQDNVIESSTAEGGTGTADSSGVIYTGTAVTSKVMRVLGYLEYTLTTAGTWVTAPSLVAIYAQGGRLPGETVQVRRNQTGAVATDTVHIPSDDTIPQSTEGTQFMSQAITPKTAANALRIVAFCNFGSNVQDSATMALFRDSDADAIAVSAPGAISVAVFPGYLSHFLLAGSAAAMTFKLRAGLAANTLTFNGYSGSRRYAGAYVSFIEITEIMV